MTLYDWTGLPLNKPPSCIMPSVSAVIIDQNRRLLLQRRDDNNYWSLPGGRVEICESVEKAIIREVFEETGFRVVVKKLIGIYSNPENYAIASYSNGDIIHYVNLCFLCTTQSGSLRGSLEGKEVHFFLLNSLPDKILLSHRIRIQDAIADEKEAFIR